MNYTINDILENANALYAQYDQRSDVKVTYQSFPCNITDIKCYLPNLDTDVEMPLFPDSVKSQGNKIATRLKNTIIKTSEHTEDSFKLEIRIPDTEPLTFTYTKDDPVLLVVYDIQTRGRLSIKLKRFAFVYESELTKAFNATFPHKSEYKPLNISNAVTWDIFGKCPLFYKDTDKYSNGADFLLSKKTNTSSHYFHSATSTMIGTIPEEKDISMKCINLSYFVRMIPKYGTGITRAVLSATISALCLAMRNICLDKVHVDIRSLDAGEYTIEVFIGRVKVVSSNFYLDDATYDHWILLSNKKALAISNMAFTKCKELRAVPYCNNSYMLAVMENREGEYPKPTEHPSIHVVEERFESWVNLGVIISEHLTKTTGAPPNSFKTLIDI